MKRLMPIGYDDFAQVRQKQLYFVDKTYFIKEMLTTPGQVKLITRPRRFGKTLNLSMLDYFFNVEHAAMNRELFNGTAIESLAEGHYLTEQGKYPVVFFTIKGWQYGSWESMAAQVPKQISRLFGEFAFLLSGDKLPAAQKNNMSVFMDGKADIDDCQSALSVLMQALHHYYGQRVVLLLDEYDAPIQDAWTYGYYDKCIAFMRNFLTNALKTNRDLAFAVLTGVTRVSKESIFSGLNNLAVCSVLSGQFEDCFGFTQAEVDRMAADYGAEDKLPEIRAWYDGYRFGAAEIYNPFSVINYFANDCKPDAYWLNTSSNSILRFLLKHASTEKYEEVRGLLAGGAITSAVDEGVVFTDLEEDEDALYAMMLTTGYLKPVQREADFAGQKVYALSIPNEEVRRAYANEITRYMQRQWPALSRKNLAKAQASLLHGQPDGFVAVLQHILKASASYHDKQTGKRHEGFYHGLVLCLVTLLFGTYEVRSNRESGQGRYDIALFPADIRHTGVIIELKESSQPDKLPQLASEALRQIQEKDYLREFKERGISQVWQYGIAFSGESVEVSAGQE